MTDYSVRGSFGDVKLWNTCIASGLCRSLDHITHIGWHKVNHQYQINRPEGTPHDMLIMTLSGEGFIRIGDKTYTAIAGTVAVIPGGTPHAYGGNQGTQWEFHWINYHGAFSRVCTQDIVQNGTFMLDAGVPSIRQWMLPLTEGALPGIRREATESALLHKILHTLVQTEFVPQHTEPEPQLSIQIQQLIDDSLQQDFCLDALVDQLHYSKEHIIRVFKNATGMTPYHYWKRARHRKICNELERSDVSVSHLAMEYGFSSVSSFSNEFRKQSGLSPSQYRKYYELHQN